MDHTVIPVGGERPYDVVVGRDLNGHLAPLLAGAERVAVVHTASVGARAAGIADTLRSAGRTTLLVEVPDAERAKTIGTAEKVWDDLGAAGFTRTDTVVGVGGGALTDLAGFVAACWLRGVRWVPVSTSLLGMVDAAVGGKTGVNTTAGKNLVGAFHPPAGVLCDLGALDDLPTVDVAAGLAEVVKCGFIADPVILDLVEKGPGDAVDPHSPVLRELVERAIRVKADVVAGDLRESARREILNYGHTLGHAIEKIEGYRWRHGHAVAVGTVYAGALGHAAGRLDADTASRHRSVLSALGLPVTYPAGAWPDLLTAMRIDKKARGARLRFVVLDGLARPSILDGPSDDLLAEAFQAVAT